MRISWTWYSQRGALLRRSIRSILDGLKIDKAHIVGLSMGGMATLHFGLTYPSRARSLLVAGAGYGSEPGERGGSREGSGHHCPPSSGRRRAWPPRRRRMPTALPVCNSRTRTCAGLRNLKAMLAEHSAKGRGQYPARRAGGSRPSIFELEDKLWPPATLPIASSSPVTRVGRCLLLAGRLHQAALARQRAWLVHPQQRPRRQHRGAGRSSTPTLADFLGSGRRRPLAFARCPRSVRAEKK